MRTNCDNCGAVLVEGECKHCGTKWFERGFRIGEHGCVSSAKFDISTEAIEVTRWRDEYKRYIQGKTEYNVSLDIVGLTAQEMRDLYDLIYNKYPKKP